MPLTQNLAKRAIVRSTIALDFETMIDEALALVTAEDAHEWFANAGYALH